MNIQQTAAVLSTALGVTFDKVHENAYQRVYKYSSGSINLGGVVVTSSATRTLVYDFTIDGRKFTAVPSLRTVTEAQAI